MPAEPLPAGEQAPAGAPGPGDAAGSPAALWGRDAGASPFPDNPHRSLPDAPPLRRMMTAVVGGTTAVMLGCGLLLWALDRQLAGRPAGPVWDGWLADRAHALGLALLLQAVAGALALGWLLRRRVLRPLRRLTDQASALARPDQGGGPRLDWGPHSAELGAVGHHLNRAVERIDGLLATLAQRQADLHRQAMLDPLTGLPNQRLFVELFAHAAALARRSGQPLTLLCIELDRFAQLDAQYGRDAGDALLRVLGRRMRQAMRGTDLVGRLEGDRFVALLCEVQDGQAVAHAARRLILAVEQPVPRPDPADGELKVSASIGIARFPFDGRRFDELLQRAEQAMGRAKAAGQGRFALYHTAEPAS